MICPRCGAYSPYNTAVCNRCGTKLLGSKAGKSPRRSRSRQYYRRTRKSDWERSRDEFLTKANDTLDEIMADPKRRMMLIAAVIAVLALLAGSVLGCASCACGGCDGCAREGRPAVSASDIAGDKPENEKSEGGGGLLHSMLGSSEETSDADVSVTDAD